MPNCVSLYIFTLYRINFLTMKHILLFAFAFISSTSLMAVNYTANAGLGTWSVATSWTPNGVPTAGDNVTIPDGSTIRILGTTESCSSVFLDCNSLGSSTNANLILIGASSLTISGNLTLDEDFALIGIALVNIANTSSVSVGGNLTMNCFQSTGTKIFMSSGASTLNLGGSFTMGYGTAGTLTSGTNGSTFNFNGSVAQTIPTTNASIVYNNITTNNSHLSGATFDGALSSSNCAGTLNNASGILNDGGFNHVLGVDFTNSGTYNGSGTIDLTGDFTNSGTFTSTGCNINIEGDWNNTGTYTFNTGDIVTFDGSTGTNTIDGATAWYELVINHTGTGVDVNSGAQTIRSILDLDDGVFSVDGAASMTLLSDGSGTAQLDEIEATASWDGTSNLTVQRQIPKTAQSFTSIGSPVSSTTLASWSDDNIIYTGDGAGSFTGADFETFGWHNTYWYDEGAADGTMNNGFTKATTTAQAVGASNSFRAFHIYTDAVTYDLDVTGVPNTGDVNIPLDYDGAFAGNQAGWNLIANPYPCTIDFDLFVAGGMVDGYFVYNDGLANYNYWDGTTSLPLVGGMTNLIPHTQGFWVRSTGLTSLPITESDKSRTDQAFYKSSNGSYMRIGISGNVNTFGDGAVILERDDYTENYDVDVDIQKFSTLDPDNAPSLYTVTPDGYNLCFNKIADESVSIPLVAKAGTLAQGDYTLDFDIPSTFMEGSCITLEDLHTGTMTDLRSDTTYTYVSNDTTTLPRFILHMVKDFNTNVVDLTCFGTTDGEVAIDGSGITGSTFELLDGSGNSVFNGTAVNDAIQFLNVPAGEYEVSTNHASTCSAGNFFITVEEPAQVTADFTLVQDTVYLDQGGVLDINNLSSGTNFVWDFGNGTTSTDANPSTVYTTPGVYQVMLTADNDNVGACTQTSSQNVIVMNGPLSIDDINFEEYTNAFVNNGKVVVDFELENQSDVKIDFVDVSGKLIASKERNVSNSRITLISTESLSAGVYFVNITIEGQRISQKLFID